MYWADYDLFNSRRRLAIEAGVPFQSAPLLISGKSVSKETSAQNGSDSITLLDLFEFVVDNNAHSEAVRHETHSLTFKDLDILSNQLGHHLRSKGVKEETMVPICMDRSLEMIIGILGVLKAGGAYVPIDPGYPQSRIRLILKETKSPLALTHKRTSDKIAGTIRTLELIEWEEVAPLIRSQPASLPPSNLKPEHLAYVIFTSGSTGQPKGVMVEHGQLLNATEARNSYYREFSNTLLVPSFAFDASLAAIFGSLCSGGCLFIGSQEDLRNPHQLNQVIPQLNTLLCVPSYYAFLLEEGLLQNAKLSRVILGGETVSPELVLRHFKANSETLLYNEYGPTETTIWATVEQINPSDPLITIGLPIEGAEAYILDSEGNLLPENHIGELHIGGKGVARGYLNDPHRTAQHFVDNPFSPTKSRLYKTGDLCYQLADNRIVFVGRADDQIKLNGHRIELGEIESVLLRFGGVKQAAVVAKRGKQDVTYMVAFVQPTSQFDQHSVREYLRTQLPGYMIPNVWVKLDKFPLTVNGKIDRLALQKFEENTGEGPRIKRPTDPIAGSLFDLWQTHLPVQNITVNDDFFNLGGNSIMAMTLVASIRRELKVDMSVRELFEYPTITKLAQRISVKSLTPKAHTYIRTNGPRPEFVPLSFGQESLWLVDQLGESLSYHLPIAVRIDGDVNINALTLSLRDLLERHEALRTVIRETSAHEQYQYLLPAVDWKPTHLQSHTRRVDLAELVQLPFDLSKDFMLRVWLIEEAPEENILLVVIHHIAFDAWSKRIFLEELWSGYRTHLNQLSHTPPLLSIQYADYAHWQRSAVRKKSYDRKLEYWKIKLQDLSPLQLLGDFIADQDNIEGATTTFTIPHPTLENLKILSRRQGSTLFMTLLAGFKALLYRYCSQEDICVGTAIAGREEPGTENLIGYFINSLALRTEVNGEMSFLDLLDKIKQTTLEAYEAKDVPFEKVVAETGVERMAGQNPLFQVMFNLQNVPASSLGETEGLRLSFLDIPQTTAKFDLTFSLTETEGGLEGSVEFRTGKFLPTTIERMIQHYILLLESAFYHPSEKIVALNILSDEEREQLLSTSDLTVQASTATVLDLLEEQAKKTPDRIAVFFGDQQISYKTLEEKSNQLAHLLQEQGVSEETLVLLCMHRSLEMIVAILGILKSGAAYVPIDPAYPQDRKKFIQQDTAAKFAVTDAENREELSIIGGAELVIIEIDTENLSRHPTQKAAISVEPGHLAYVIYTSGSTGKPKGVMIEHRNVYSFISWCREEFACSPIDVVYAATSICFDLSVFELFYSLSTGIPIRLLQDGLEIQHYLTKDSKVMVNTVPSVVGHLLEEGTDLSNVSVLNMAGEPITKKILGGLDVNNMEVRNLYGPTEDTTYSTVYRVRTDRETLIGRPISETSVYIVNPKNGLNPVGVPGEICLGGSGLARGYFNRPDLTAEKFVANPFVPTAGARMYKTGDIGRWLANGQIEYLGRKDDQVKIRGYRVELGEIEKVLQQHDKVRQAVVLAKADHKGNQHLVGYLVVGGSFDRNSTIAFLKQRLPHYMVPSLWMQLEAFPLTPNGKIDRKKLPEPYRENREETAFVAPRNEVEKGLAQIWKDLLKTENVGIHDDFFASGGHSLMATQFVAAAKKDYNIDLRIKDLFAFPTIAGLTENIDFQVNAFNLPALKAHLPRPDRLPLSYNQESLWFIDRLSGSAHYHIPLALKIQGNLDENALNLAFKNVLERHEVLRTTIQNDDGVSQQVIKDNTEHLITLIDGTLLQNDLNNLQQIIGQELDKPFDLSADYMIRASLIRFAPNNHLLVAVIHHIAFDGWSTFLLLNELTTAYKAYQEGQKPTLPPLPFQYSDYAIWQKQSLQGDFLRSQLKYWREKLQNIVSLQLPLDYTRPAVQHYTGAVEVFQIDNYLKEKLLRVGQEHSATLFMTLLTVFKVLLHRYSSQEDVCIGTVTAGRQQKDTERLIGYFARTLPIRSKVLPQATFIELLEEVRSNSLEAFDNQEVPFEQIVAQAGVGRDLSKNSLFQVMFILQNYPETTALKLGDVTLTQQAVKQTTSKFDLSFIITESDSGLHLSVEYNTSLFKKTTINQISSDYINLVKQIVSRPSKQIGHYTPDYSTLKAQNGATSPAKADMDIRRQNKQELIDKKIEQQKTEVSEKIISKIWGKALGLKHINIKDNFFEIGGQSLIAVQVMSLLEKELGIKLPLSILFKHPTIKDMARAIGQKDKKAKVWSSLVPIKTTGNKPPLYIIHGGGANILPFYGIAKNMHPDQPVYGLQPKGLDGKEKPLTSVEAIASHFIEEILQHNADELICLAGYSFGGIIAFEMAKQLKSMGKEVEHLVMFDTIAYQRAPQEHLGLKLKNRLKQAFGKRWLDLYLFAKHRKTFRRLKTDSLLQKVKRFRIWMGVEKEAQATEIMKTIKKIEDSHREASENYVMTPYDGTIHLMKAKTPTYYNTKGYYLGWEAYVKRIDVHEMDGEHTSMFAHPNDVKFAQTLQRILDS